MEWEVRDADTPFWQHAVAGSCAGIAEHVAMFPMDTVKTHIQASPAALSVSKAFRGVLQERGILGLMRGSAAIGVGCIPAHVGLFGTYELARSNLLDADEEAQAAQPMRAAVCGALGTVVHDCVLTPADVVKQRLQLGRYLGPIDCISSMLRHEGVASLYRSLPATLAMNVPYTGILVAANESLKPLLGLTRGASERSEQAPGLHWHFVSAGISGAVASAFTLPLDNVKTRLQTQGASGLLSPKAAPCAFTAPRYSGFMTAARAIWVEQGVRGFARGFLPRIVQAAPSAAVCWGTYEGMRGVLQNVSVEVSLSGEAIGTEPTYTLCNLSQC